MAASHLERLGYTVLKTASNKGLIFDLVAYDHHHTYFITARRGRDHQTAKDIIQAHQDLIIEMQSTQVPETVEKQLWVYQKNDGFVVYRLFEKGLMKKESL